MSEKMADKSYQALLEIFTCLVALALLERLHVRLSQLTSLETELYMDLLRRHIPAAAS